MDKTDILTGILDNVDYSARNCHLCPSEAITEMVDATVEIDKNVSQLSGAPHLSPPGGEGGAPAARFYLISIKEKVQSFFFFNIGSRELTTLEGVLYATQEFRRGVEDAAAARL